MHSNDGHFEQRRRVLTLLGTSAVALPILGLAGCGGEEPAQSSGAGEMSSAADSMQSAAEKTSAETRTTTEKAMAEAEKAMEPAKQAASDAMDSAKSAAQSAADSATEKARTIATDAAGSMTKVDESSSQAKQLGYRHNAADVDKSKQPRYAAGQQCSNCAIYQGGDAEWGGCPLFAGKQVKATGWCSAYVKAS